MIDLPPSAALWTPPALIRASEPCAPAAARETGSLPLPVFPLPVRGAQATAAKTVTFRGSAVDPANLTTYDGAPFQGLAIGDAAADRHVLLAVCGTNGTRTVESATIGGVTATKVHELQSGNGTIAVLRALVTDGTTANVAISWSGAQSRCGIAWWTATGIGDGTEHHKVTSTANPSVATVNTLAGGFAIAAAFDGNNNNRTYTWTNVTERYDETVESGINHSGGDAATASTGTLEVTATRSGTNNVYGMVVVSW